MKAIAIDNAWKDVTWSGTVEKISLQKDLDVLLAIITGIITKTYPDCTLPECHLKMKSFLRHTKERIHRKGESVENVKPNQ